jgi:hypothetical protein
MEIFQMVMAKQNFLDEKEQRKVKIFFAIKSADNYDLNILVPGRSFLIVF